MSLAEVPLVLTLVGLAAYTVLGGADFGAGLWFLVTGRGRGQQEVREQTFHAMAPVWEANHVWLIFVLVVCWTAYPVAFGSLFSTLVVPLFIAAVGIIFRGTAYALRSGNPSPRQDSAIGAVFSLSSILTPFALGAAVGGIASGRVPVGNAEGDLITSWLNPTSILIGAVAVATSAYMAAVFLAADAARQRDESMTAAFRRRATVAGVGAGALALAGLIVLSSDAPELFEGLTQGPGVVALALSIAAGLSTLALVARARYEPARYTAAVAVAMIIAGWGLAQEPVFLPGLTVQEAAAEDSTIVVLLVGLGVGTLLLVPSLFILFRLVLTGRFDVGFSLGSDSTGEADGAIPLRVTPVAVAAAIAVIGALVLILAEVSWLQLTAAVVMLLGIGVALPALVVRDGAAEEAGSGGSPR